MKITLTIGIPAYQNHLGVERIINSLEDRDDIEILISEDVPIQEDGLKDLPKQDNIRHWKQTPPLGAVPNWNAVLEQAAGQFIWVIHHDEVPHFPNGLDAFVRHLKETDADLLISRLNKDTDRAFKRVFRTDLIRKVLLRLPLSILLQNYIGSPSNMIVRKNRLETFDENLKWFVDMEWFYRLIKKVKTIELSKFEITPFPHEQSIKATLGAKITAISLSEIGYICAKHRIGNLFCRIWRMKIHLRETYIRMRERA